MDKTKDFIFLVDGKDEGWGVYLQEPEGSNFILFIGLREEIAISFKERLDLAIKTYYDLDCTK